MDTALLRILLLCASAVQLVTLSQPQECPKGNFSVCECQLDYDGGRLIFCNDRYTPDSSALERDIELMSFWRLEVKRLNMASRHLVYLRKNFFGNMKIKMADLALYKLKTFHPESLASQKEVLEEVEISEADSSNIPTEIFSKTTKLTRYSFTDSFYIEVVPEEMFDGMMCASTLNEIKFSHNKIKSIENQAFAHLINLTYLDLNHNKLKVFPANALPLLPRKLSFLNLRSNLFEKLPFDLLSAVPDGTTIDVSKNRVTSLSKAELNWIYWKNINFIAEDMEFNCSCSFMTVSTLFKSELSRSQIRGTCYRPEKLKDRSISSLLSSDFTYCNNV